MLSPKHWKFEALARLLLSAFLCVLGGTLLVTVLHYAGPRGHASAVVYLSGAGGLLLLTASVFLLNQAWRYEKLLRQALFFMLCFTAALALSLWVEKVAGPPPKRAAGELMLIVEPLILLLYAHFVREHGITWSEAFGLNNSRGRAVLYGVAAACIFLPLGWTLQWASTQAMMHLHWQPHEQEVVETLQQAGGWRNQVALGIVAILLAPVVEEIFFRGILYPAIKQTGFPRLALWLTSVLFALMHKNAASFVPLLLLAVMLTLLYERTNNLLGSITAHAVFNGVNFAVLCLTEARS